MQYIGNNGKRAVAHGATWLLLLPINVSRGCRAGYQSHDSIMEGLCLGHVPCASLQLGTPFSHHATGLSWTW